MIWAAVPDRQRSRLHPQSAWLRRARKDARQAVGGTARGDVPHRAVVRPLLAVVTVADGMAVVIDARSRPWPRRRSP